MTWTTKFVPPDLQEFLEAHLPDAAQWYEVRCGTSVATYTVEDYDIAVANAKALRKMFPSNTETFYVWMEDGLLREERLF